MAKRAESVGVVRRQRWSEAEAQDIVREAASSGQNLREFCQGRGVAYERVRRWRIRLEERTARSKRMRTFLPVEVVASTAAANSGGASAGVVEFELGPCVVRARGEVSESMLVRALRAVRESARC